MLPPALPAQPSARAGETGAERPYPAYVEQLSSEGASCVGALVLRGNRCVLVRSLASPPLWSGMRLPYVELDTDESAVDGALRAVSEHCDIDGPSELELLPHVPPAVLYLEGGLRVLVYAFNAVQPPPRGQHAKSATFEAAELAPLQPFHNDNPNTPHQVGISVC